MSSSIHISRRDDTCLRRLFDGLRRVLIGKTRKRDLRSYTFLIISYNSKPNEKEYRSPPAIYAPSLSRVDIYFSPLYQSGIYNRVRTYEKKELLEGTTTRRQIHPRRLNKSSARKHEAEPHARGSAEIHPLLYYIMPNYDS